MSETRQATPLQAEAHAEAPSPPSICTADVFSALAVAAAMGALYFVLGFAFHLVAGAIDQRMLSYRPVKWFGYEHDYESVFVGLSVGLLAFFIVGIDLWERHAAGKELLSDVAYFPRFWHAPEWLHSPTACMTIIFGFLALAVYYALFALDVFTQGLMPAVVVAPNRLFGVLLFAWGLVWHADSLIRPERGTVVAARLFLLAVFLFAVGFLSTDFIFRE